MARNVQNSSISFAKNIILTKNTQFRSATLLVAANDKPNQIDSTFYTLSKALAKFSGLIKA